MAQVFRKRSNTIARANIVGLVILIGLLAAAVFGHQRSEYATRISYAVDQPVPFSHEHHVAGLGIDCRYCHTAVETSPFAGIPPTSTCMSCHSRVWTEAPVLAPVRESWRTNTPLVWNRVHDLPDFAYFNHSVHINAGVSCVSCHGQVDHMPLIEKTETLNMRWCLDCHRDPAEHIRPRDAVFDMQWTSSESREQRITSGRALMERYHVELLGLTNCSMCHR